MGTFDLVRPLAAGIDLGSRAHLVAAPASSGGGVRSFGCFTRDLIELGEWLLSMGAKDVAMEATGVYWVPVYEALESMGLKVALVDGRAAKALPGRKSDVQDCQWIRDLHAYGLVRPCLVPEGEVLALRSYWRQRFRLVEQRAEQIQLMQKALEQMNVQIHKVLSSLSGTSGLAIVRAIVGGERSAAKLAALVHHRVKASQEKIALSLEGTWAAHHVFGLAQALETYDFFTERMIACDSMIDAAIAKLAGDAPAGPRGAGRSERGLSFNAKDGLVKALGVDPTKIDGIDERTAITLLSELGSDLTRFPTEKHFSSYLRVSPRNAITGGRARKDKGKRAPSASRATTALKLSAQSLACSDSALGAYYRRLKARIGPARAKTAVARKIAICYYRLLVHGQVYEDPGASAYEERFRQKRVRWLSKQAAKLGLNVVPATAPEPAAQGVFP